MADSARVVIVKTGSAPDSVRLRYGDFETWIAAGMGLEAHDVMVVEVFSGDPLPDPQAVAGAVVTGSASFVSDRETWSLAAEAWLRRVVSRETPVLGICYGHQLLAQALGGEVGANPRGREIGTVTVDVSAAVRSDDALLGELPELATVQATHVESVLSLPDGAIRLGSNAADENHAFSYGAHAWGVQFHPEFDANVMRGYIEARADVLREEGFEPARLIGEARDSPAGTSVLRRFGEIARAKAAGSAS